MTADRTMGAILLNPPLTTSGASTRNRLKVAAAILGCDRVDVSNVFSIPTSSLTEVNLAGRDPEGWLTARPRISRLVSDADEVLIGWGIGGLGGSAKRNLMSQAAWIAQQLTALDRTYWTVSVLPRHPSRWHQYVSDLHGRAGEGTFSERLARVIVEQAPVRLVGSGQ